MNSLVSVEKMAEADKKSRNKPKRKLKDFGKLKIYNARLTCSAITSIHRANMKE